MTDWSTCRFCKATMFDGSKSLKYGVRHYAHFDCYLDAGKSLDALPPWQVGRFPFQMLKQRGLLDKAREMMNTAEALKQIQAAEIYFVFVDYGVQGTVFNETEIDTSKTECIKRIVDGQCHGKVLAVFRAKDGRFDNVTTEILEEAAMMEVEDFS